MKTKTRKQKAKEYQSKYGDIPIDYRERISYMIDMYNLSESKMDEIIKKRNEMLNNLFFYECKVVQLLEEPEGSARPRFRVINKRNFNQVALESNYVHVYTPHAAEDHSHMKELCEQDLMQLDHLINTPCVVRYDAFFKTPSYFSITDTFLAETGVIRPPIDKPDWDNIGKKYCDMYNHNIWLDDALVFTGEVNKYYSILPRVEIHLKYMNALFTKQQYKRMIQRKDYDNYPISYLDQYGRIVNNNV